MSLHLIALVCVLSVQMQLCPAPQLVGLQVLVAKDEQLRHTEAELQHRIGVGRARLAKERGLEAAYLEQRKHSPIDMHDPQLIQNWHDVRVDANTLAQSIEAQQSRLEDVRAERKSLEEEHRELAETVAREEREREQKVQEANARAFQANDQFS